VFPGGFSKPRIFFLRSRLPRSRVHNVFLSFIPGALVLGKFERNTRQAKSVCRRYTLSSAIIVFFHERVTEKEEDEKKKKKKKKKEKEEKLISLKFSGVAYLKLVCVCRMLRI